MPCAQGTTGPAHAYNACSRFSPVVTRPVCHTGEGEKGTARVTAQVRRAQPGTLRVFVSSVFRSILSHQIDGVRKEKERLIAAQHIRYHHALCAW